MISRQKYTEENNRKTIGRIALTFLEEGGKKRVDGAKIESVRQVRLSRMGYDRIGRYFGVGRGDSCLYAVTFDNGEVWHARTSLVARMLREAVECCTPFSRVVIFVWPSGGATLYVPMTELRQSGCRIAHEG